MQLLSSDRLILASALLLLAASASAEVHSLTLKEAVRQALEQNPDVVLGRLEEQKSLAAVNVAKDPFVPKLYGGSGLAYTSGYPSSIEGNAPSIFEARTEMSLFNRPKSYELAEARESARTASLDTSGKQDEVAYRTASLYLDAEQLDRGARSLALEIQTLEATLEAVKLRVAEGRDLPLAGKRAELDLGRARQRRETALANLDYTEESLAITLGFPAGDRVRPADDERGPVELPATEGACIEAALRNNKEIRRVESQMQAKAFEARAQRSQRLPQFDLVAQYSLFAKYNYQNYFTKFQRNNGQLGVSIKIPLLVGAAPSGLEAEAEADVAKLRTQVNEIRNRTALETRRSFQDVNRAESARDFAKLDLEVAREQVSVALDQLQEGRATLQAIGEARLLEQEKWIAYYDSQHALEKARYALLRQAGMLQAALR